MVMKIKDLIFSITKTLKRSKLPWTDFSGYQAFAIFTDKFSIDFKLKIIINYLRESKHIPLT